MTTAPKLPEGLEPVAWAYVPSAVWKDKVLTDDPTKAQLAREMGCDVRALTDHSDAQAALQAQAAEKDAEIAALTREAWAWNQALTAATRGQFKARELIQKWRHAAENLGLEGLASLADCADELEAAIDSALLAAKEAK